MTSKMSELEGDINVNFALETAKEAVNIVKGTQTSIQPLIN